LAASGAVANEVVDAIASGGPARLLPLVLVGTKLQVLVVVLVVVVRLHMLVLLGNRLMWPMLVCKGLLMEVLQLRLLVMK
jgi:hypothetical protein